MIELSSCPKGYMSETQRAVSPEETLGRIKELLPAAGITRVADITDLDRVGIPVFSSIRPMAESGAISVYNGKGATPVEAEVSAIMEGIERCSAECGDDTSCLLTGDYTGIAKEHTSVFPSELILPRGVSPNTPVSWTPGYDIVNDEEIYLPSHAVYHPLSLSHGRLFRTNTNGLASGNTMEEAVFHALMELIERDAWSLVEILRRPCPIVTGIEDGLAADLIAKFREAGVEITVRDMTHDIGVPTFAAVSDDVALKDPTLLTIGMGTHTNAGIALLRALTEVAQSRLTQIHGAREDTDTADMRKRIGYERTKRLNRRWFDDAEEVEFSKIPSMDSDDFLTDISNMVSRLGERGMDRVIVSDLTRDDIGVPVVRVIVPGLEVYAMDPERIGERCRNAADNSLPGPQY